MVHKSSLQFIRATFLLAPSALAYGHGNDAKTARIGPAPDSMSVVSMNSSSASTQSYFSYPDRSGLMLGHIVLMSIAWALVLPIGKPAL